MLTPASAGAATASVEARPTAGGQSIGTLVYRANPGEANQLEVVLDPDGYRVRDSLPLTPGPGCSPTFDPGTIRCGYPPGTFLRGADVALGDGGDSALLDGPIREGTVVQGGSGDDDLGAGGLTVGGSGGDVLTAAGGNDTLQGGSGNDQLFAGAGEDLLQPGAGRDIVQSGAGNDRIEARDGAFERISCGEGRDSVLMDALDFPGISCLSSSLQRRGAPRALPLEGMLGLDDVLRMGVACPGDAPRACRGAVSATLGRRLIGSDRFRVSRGNRGNGAVRPNRRQRRKIRRGEKFGRYAGRFRITVRSRDGRGRLRTVSREVALSVVQRSGR